MCLCRLSPIVQDEWERKRSSLKVSLLCVLQRWPLSGSAPTPPCFPPVAVCLAQMTPPQWSCRFAQGGPSRSRGVCVREQETVGSSGSGWMSPIPVRSDGDLQYDTPDISNGLVWSSHGLCWCWCCSRCSREVHIHHYRCVKPFSSGMGPAGC